MDSTQKPYGNSDDTDLLKRELAEEMQKALAEGRTIRVSREATALLCRLKPRDKTNYAIELDEAH